MDSKSLVLLLLVCVMFLHVASGLSLSLTDITHSQANVHPLPTRKMMMMMKKESEWGGANGEEEVKKKKDLEVKEELRTVPSGPDPLHHHVNPPKQPRTNSHLP